MKKKVKVVQTTIVERLTALMTAAFGLVAALAWNDAIRSLFIGPCDAENAGALCMFRAYGPWAYAIFVTLLVVLVTLWIAKVSEKAKPKAKG